MFQKHHNYKTCVFSKDLIVSMSYLNKFVFFYFFTSATACHFSGESLYDVIVDLFVAGSETTSNGLNWCILYMQEFPEIQKRCQQEIAEVEP